MIILGSRPPALHHYEFANLIMDVAELYNVSRIYTVGGIYASVAHTAPPRIMAVINNPGLKTYVTRYGVELGLNYHGPTSINGLIIGTAKQRNIDGISLWGQIPNYLGDIANPGVCQAILKTLTRMLDIDINFAGIEIETRRADQRIDELVSYIRQQSPDLDRHIKKLEQGINPEPSEEDNQSFFRDIEEFLRRQKGRTDSD